MILSATLSKPSGNIGNILDRPYEKIKIKVENSSKGTGYYGEMFTKTQVFHKHFTEQEVIDFIAKHGGTTFKNCIQRTESEEIIIMANKKGKITKLTKPLKYNNTANDNNLKILPEKGQLSGRKKNYILQEGIPVPFLVLLGIMTPEGKVISSKYDKFRQINRFLEFVEDVIPDVQKQLSEEHSDTIKIVDFGCGKSYLTFALHYFLTEIKKMKCDIEGLDLKQDVINYCNDITHKLELKNLIFHTGNISDYSGKENPDIIITLHACNTATDYALEYAVEHNTKAILSVPCCQHEVNTQLQENKSAGIEMPQEFAPLLKWGIIREKFSSLVTDALRGEWLEQMGYKVQMLEFIDMEHTPKNILIRAVKKNTGTQKTPEVPELIKALNINPEIWKQ